MTDKLKEALAKWRLIDKGDRVAVALSGGCDSVALLNALYELREELGITLAAAHVNHHIRGDEAERDAEFCRALCEKRGVEFVCFNVDVPSEVKRTGESEELCARRLRYGVLDGLVAKGYKVASAHTMSDNAETVLFNLSRGSGIKGLCGIPPRRGEYIRPLLLCTRADTEKYCADNSLDFVTDSTNACDVYTRNYIRHNVLKPLKAALPACEEAMSRMSSQFSDIDSMLERMAEGLLAKAKCERGWRCDVLIKGERPVFSRALHRLAYEQTGHAPDCFHTEELCEVVKSGGRLQLAGNYFAVSDGVLRFIKNESGGEPFCFELTEGELDTPWLKLEISVFDAKTKQNVHNSVMLCEIDCGKIVGKAQIRCRMESDIFCPAKRRTKPLRRWMNESRIAAEKRGLWPVIVDDMGIIFVPEIGVAARVLPDENTKSCMIIKSRGK